MLEDFQTSRTFFDNFLKSPICWPLNIFVNYSNLSQSLVTSQTGLVLFLNFWNCQKSRWKLRIPIQKFYNEESRQIKSETKFPSPKVRNYGAPSTGVQSPEDDLPQRLHGGGRRRTSLKRSSLNQTPQDIYHLPMPNFGEFADVGRNKFVLSTETLTTIYNKQGSLKVIIVKNCDNKQIIVFDDKRNVSAIFRGKSTFWVSISK